MRGKVESSITARKSGIRMYLKLLTSPTPFRISSSLRVNNWNSEQSGGAGWMVLAPANRKKLFAPLAAPLHYKTFTGRGWEQVF
jgi:hypothetical protein